MLYESTNFRLETDDQIATLWLHFQGRSGDVISHAFLDDLDRAISVVEKTPGIDLLIVRNEFPQSFQLGYDLNELMQLGSCSEITDFAARGQQILQRFANLGSKVLTVAFIDGPVSGAGLEIALACDYRLGVRKPTNTISFPEVQRGYLPCFGGTIRLSQLVGPRRAGNLLIENRTFSATEGCRFGLIDAVFSDQRKRIDLQTFIDRLQDHPRKPRRFGTFFRRVVEQIPFGNWFLTPNLPKCLAEMNEEIAPAAYAVVKTIRSGIFSIGEGLACERSSMAQLVNGEAFENCRRLESTSNAPLHLYPEPINPISPVPERIGIVGGGELGSHLAHWLIRQGKDVVLQELSETRLLLANQRVQDLLEESRRRGFFSVEEKEKIQQRFRRTTSWIGFDQVGLVIETVDEDVGVKLQAINELERVTRQRTILASTTSTIRIESLQNEAEVPNRIVGLHFNDLPDEARIVEIVRGPQTDNRTLGSLHAWMRQLDKTPILVADRPGRILQRLQMAYLSEAINLIAEGLPPELVDEEMRTFGMTEGPFEIIDRIGFERLSTRTENLLLARGDTFARNLLLDKMRAFGWNGQSTREGFYRYRGKRKRPNSLARMVMWQDLDEDVISHYVFDPLDAMSDGVERLLLRTINESANCLSEEPDTDPETIDLACAWGLDWAPSTGGPLHYADVWGLQNVLERLMEFADRFGKRFEPCVELQRRAEAGEPFYGDRQFPSSRRNYRLAG